MFTHPSAVTVGHECLRPSAGQRLRNLLEGLRRRGACEAPRVHGLARATTFSVTPGRGGLSVTGVRGTVVVTQTGDLDDHVLGPGERFQGTPGGLVVIWALSDAEVALGAPVSRARGCAG